MSFLKKLFGGKEKPIRSYEDFWAWFQQNERKFYAVVKSTKGVDEGFLNILVPKLHELNDSIYCCTGMFDDSHAELIITAEGKIRNFVVVEELERTAPKNEKWKITALNPEYDIEDVNITMDKYEFNKDNLSFFSNDDPDYPDEIDIAVVYDDFPKGDESTVVSDVYIFLDNYLGELNFAVNIDALKVIGKKEALKELIPITKLKDYLAWREREFVEKYEGVIQNTESHKYAIYEATISKSQRNIIAVIDRELLD